MRGISNLLAQSQGDVPSDISVYRGVFHPDKDNNTQIVSSNTWSHETLSARHHNSSTVEKVLFHSLICIIDSLGELTAHFQQLTQFHRCSFQPIVCTKQKFLFDEERLNKPIAHRAATQQSLLFVFLLLRNRATRWVPALSYINLKSVMGGRQ